MGEQHNGKNVEISRILDALKLFLVTSHSIAEIRQNYPLHTAKTKGLL